MRRIFLFVFAAAALIAAQARAEEASCDLRKCMSICRNDYESGCAGMCGRIISLCRQLVAKPERTRNARRSQSSRGDIKLDAQARIAAAANCHFRICPNTCRTCPSF
jgi:hypothetical protein